MWGRIAAGPVEAQVRKLAKPFVRRFSDGSVSSSRLRRSGARECNSSDGGQGLIRFSSYGNVCQFPVAGSR